MNKTLLIGITLASLLVSTADAKISKEFSEDGTLKFEYNYQNGKKNGITKEYYKNGKIKVKWNFKDDILNGISTKYHL